MKLDAMKTNGKQIEEGLATFDLSVTSVLHALTAEGTKIKAMIDRHIEKMIASLCMCVPQAVCSNQLTNIRVTC
jgi:hypothetical protein